MQFDSSSPPKDGKNEFETECAVEVYIACMKRFFTPLFTVAFITIISTTTLSQITPISDVQGESDVSPFQGEEVTISGKVTEYFGDTFYLQDDYGAWNGIFINGEGIEIPANPPYWNGARQPEVGDVLTVLGTVAEVDGNTELVDVSLVEFVDFWNATPLGVWLTADAFQDEQYEGTRVRIDAATILTAPDAEGFWTVTDGTAELVCWGVDTSDAGNNEDPDGPTPGDMYQIYGALHELPGGHVLHVGDIDVLALSVGALEEVRVRVFPNPASNWVAWNFPDSEPRQIRLSDAQGRVVFETVAQSSFFELDVSTFRRGSYSWAVATTLGSTAASGQLILN